MVQLPRHGVRGDLIISVVVRTLPVVVLRLHRRGHEAVDHAVEAGGAGRHDGEPLRNAATAGRVQGTKLREDVVEMISPLPCVLPVKHGRPIGATARIRRRRLALRSAALMRAVWWSRKSSTLRPLIATGLLALSAARLRPLNPARLLPLTAARLKLLNAAGLRPLAPVRLLPLIAA